MSDPTFVASEIERHHANNEPPEDETAFEYKIPHTCQYETEKPPDLYSTYCGEPAAYLVWWSPGQRGKMWLCGGHFEHVKKCEEEA